jgi:hypothetical protein
MSRCPYCGSELSGDEVVRCTSCAKPIKLCPRPDCSQFSRSEARYCGLCRRPLETWEHDVAQRYLASHRPVWRLADRDFKLALVPATAKRHFKVGLVWQIAGHLCAWLPDQPYFVSWRERGSQPLAEEWPLPCKLERRLMDSEGPVRLEHFILFCGKTEIGAWSISNFGRDDRTHLVMAGLSVEGEIVSPPIPLPDNRFLILLKERGDLLVREYSVCESQQSAGGVPMIQMELVAEGLLQTALEQSPSVYQLLRDAAPAMKKLVALAGPRIWTIDRQGSSFTCEPAGEIDKQTLSGTPIAPFVYAADSLFFRARSPSGYSVCKAHRWGEGDWQVESLPNTQMAAELRVAATEDRTYILVRTATGVSRFDAWDSSSVAPIPFGALQPVGIRLSGPIAIVLQRAANRSGAVALLDMRLEQARHYQSKGFSAQATTALLIGDTIIVLGSRDTEVVAGQMDLPLQS